MADTGKIEIINNLEKKKRRKKKKRPLSKPKSLTGYIIYASEIRKEVVKRFPDKDFGHISKLVGIEWKNLPQETKVAYEKRAQEANAKYKIDAARHVELTRLADAAQEKAREHAINNHQSQQQSAVNPSQLTLPINTTTNICNGYATTNGHSQPISSNHYLLSKDSISQSSQIITCNSSSSSSNSTTPTTPLHIIQQQQQAIATNVQYCNNNSSNNNIVNNQSSTSQTTTPQIQYQRNNIVYRKPATIRLRPKESSAQTDPIKWVKSEPKKPLRFSQKFIDYLNSC